MVNAPLFDPLIRDRMARRASVEQDQLSSDNLLRAVTATSDEEVAVSQNVAHLGHEDRDLEALDELTASDLQRLIDRVPGLTDIERAELGRTILELYSYSMYNSSEDRKIARRLNIGTSSTERGCTRALRKLGMDTMEKKQNDLEKKMENIEKMLQEILLKLN